MTVDKAEQEEKTISLKSGNTHYEIVVRRSEKAQESVDEILVRLVADQMEREGKRKSND